MVVVVSGSGRREATYFNPTGGVGGCGEGVGFVFVWKMGGRVQPNIVQAVRSDGRRCISNPKYFKPKATGGDVF
jgi:hypothetical protein